MLSQIVARKLLQPSGVQRCNDGDRSLASWKDIMSSHVPPASSLSCTSFDSFSSANFSLQPTQHKAHSINPSSNLCKSMATQTVLSTSTSPPDNSAPSINVPSSFQIEPQDGRLENKPVPDFLLAPPPLGVLSNFTGTFVGSGLNMIFRPNSGQTTFGNPVPGPPLGTPPNENVLELNLTTETLAFSNPVGNVPNRGLEKQTDIFLNGVPYVQSISDVTDPTTGRGNALPSPIHFEPGLWMHIPASTTGKLFSSVLSHNIHQSICNYSRSFFDEVILTQKQAWSPQVPLIRN